MNILLLTDEMLPGGVSRHVTDLANGLSDYGIGVCVAATNGPYRHRLNNNIKFLSIPLLKEEAFKKRPFGFFHAFVKLEKDIQNEKNDIVHSHKRYSDFLGKILKTCSQISHVSTCHNTFDNLHWFPSFGNYTITCSESIREIVINRYQKDPSKVITIYCGIKPFRIFTCEEKKVARVKLDIDPTSRVISSVGRLDPPKDRVTLLEAIHLLKQSNDLSNVIFVIVGEGKEKEKLLRLINEFGLQNNIRLYNSTVSVEAIMNVSEFCILSSIQEGLPFVILEAASVAKIHLATSVGGIPEFITHNETGLLVPPLNSELLAQAIYHLLNAPDETERMGCNAKKLFEKHHLYDRFIDETIQVYEKRLREKNRHLVHGCIHCRVFRH